MEGKEMLTFRQAQGYAILALNRMIEEGRTNKPQDELIRELDYTMFVISEEISPEEAEQQGTDVINR